MAINQEDRARQFMPFAALTGYYETIQQREKTEEYKKILSDEEIQIISDKLSQVRRGMLIAIKYYRDCQYESLTGAVSDIDLVYKRITVIKTEIPFTDIIDLQIKSEHL